MATEQIETDWVEKIGASAYASIAEMVAALECDYDRLEELRGDRATWEDPPVDAHTRPAEPWAGENPDDAEELAELEAAAGDCESREDAADRISEDPLSVEVRSGWVTPGDDVMTPEEFCILLSTGGPAVRIVGDLNGCGEPIRARLEVQDWFKPWTEYAPADQDTLLSYASQFHFAH